MRKIKASRGVILITVLWVLAILSLLALSLSKGASLEMALIRNGVGKLKAYAASRAGINYAQSLLNKSKTERDTLYQCGVKLPTGQKPEVIFKGIKVDNDAHFDILFSGNMYGSSKDYYGFEDEQGRLNLNAIDSNNYKILSNLFTQFDVSETDADNLAAAVMDWKSDTNEPFVAPQGNVKGAKDEYYTNLKVPYKTKNRPFDRIEELMLVKGMNEALFAKIKDFITVFPKNPDNGLKINFNTASDAVIIAAVNGMSFGLAKEEIKQGLIRHRNGMDNTPGTADDGIQKNSMFSASQQLYMNVILNAQGIDHSEYLRVTSVGVDESTGIKCRITAVLERSFTRNDVRIVGWRRD